MDWITAYSYIRAAMPAGARIHSIDSTHRAGTMFVATNGIVAVHAVIWHEWLAHDEVHHIKRVALEMADAWTARQLDADRVWPYALSYVTNGGDGTARARRAAAGEVLRGEA